ncbi:hypothetical protein BH10ACI3_BH10ACI3_03500 [soil metagenome]
MTNHVLTVSDSAYNYKASSLTVSSLKVKIINTMVYKYLIPILLSFGLAQSSHANARLDFNGDGRTDIAVVGTETSGQGTEQYFWYVSDGNGGYSVTPWGALDNNSGGYGDLLKPADYDGDGKTDFAVVRVPQINPLPSVGSQLYWYILLSSTGTYEVIPFGRSRSLTEVDYAVPADFDGDGKTDVAIARSTDSGMFWWILQSRDGLRVVRWGGSPGSSDLPYPADYDGDGKADLAIARFTVADPTLNWFVLQSSNGNWMTARLGAYPNDQVTTGDYDGDGKADICVVGRSSFNWRWISSRTGSLSFIHWGDGSIDRIVQGDYDGDGITDQAIYRKDQNCENFSYFWINGSTFGMKVIPFGGCYSSGIEF